MAIRDYWVYQERQSDAQWAIYFVKEFDRRKPDATTLDYTLYSENIDNATHSLSRVGLHFDTVGGYVDELLSQLVEISEVDSQDKHQLEKAILDILSN